MIHYELNDSGKVIAYEVTEIKCRRIDGDHEIHWTTPEQLCTSESNAVSGEHMRLTLELEKAQEKLDLFEKEHLQNVR